MEKHTSIDQPEIQYKLKKKGINQRYLANHYAVTDSAISRAIRGDKNCKVLRSKILKEFIN